MGEVYRARDTKLGRDVAIKVLPADFANDAERTARFQREAQVLASLNHSNIGAIHDVQQHENTEFLILELVEGETLADRIVRGPVPIDETVEIGRQIAEALSAAHEKGVVHRDLKPANIKITPAGIVKVLDFGLAKFYETDSSEMPLSQSPTVMSVRTGESVILGTVSYMSPEQARGRPVTRQTDIWAFGCVLFEMLTRRVCFSGETVSDTIAKVLKEEPEWTALDSAPPGMRRVIERCLEKDPRRRFHDAADVRLELEEALIRRPGTPPQRETRTRPWSLVVPALVFAALVLGVAVGGIWYPRADLPAQSWGGTLLSGPSLAMIPRVSPDGQTLAFAALIDGQAQVAVMNPRSGNWRVLTQGKDGGVVTLNWSADGTKIYFDHMDAGPAGVFSVPALGGETRLILEAASSPVPLPDGSIVVIRLNADRVTQLYRMKPGAGDPEPLNAVLLNAYGAAVRAFPDGREIVFYGKPADASTTEPYRLHILDLQSGKARPIAPSFNADITTSGIGGLGLAVNPVDRSVLVDIPSGDLHQVVSIPSDGKGASRVLLTLTDGTWGMDMTADGSLFVDQVSRPIAIMRFKESDTSSTPIAIIPKGSPVALELPDRGILTTTVFNGHSHLSIVKSNGEMIPFVDTEEETHEPVSLAGPSHVAFVLGSTPKEAIGLASIKDGRLVGRLSLPASEGIKSLAATTDGTTLFYSSGGTIWSIPTRGGDATKLGAGDFVSYDPSRNDLVVYLSEAAGVRLVRMPVTGGAVQPIEQRGGLRVTNLVGPEAIRNDGLIVMPFLAQQSWFLGAAILDPRTGMLRSVPLRYDADFFSLTWNQKNEIVAGASLIRSSIWHFQLRDR